MNYVSTTDFCWSIDPTITTVVFYILQEFEGTYDGWLVMGAVSLNSFTT